MIDRTSERTVRAMLSFLIEPGHFKLNPRLLTPDEALARVVDTPAYDGRADRLNVDELYERADRVGARLVIPGDREWPTRIDRLAQPPWGLWVRGTFGLNELSHEAVAIVGSRACTAYGSEVATEFASKLATNVTVVSGLAYGIDEAAHRGALAVDGSTVAVMASGIDIIYPASHNLLADKILEKDGTLVSEVAPGCTPSRSRFLARNRIIAALSRAVVVVEASRQSGSMNTAMHAKTLGVPVCAVPGPVTSLQSQGCHDLIRDEAATLVVSASNVLRSMARV